MTSNAGDDLVLLVHRAMQDAAHDGKPYRQARAAIAAVKAFGIPTADVYSDAAPGAAPKSTVRESGTK